MKRLSADRTRLVRARAQGLVGEPAGTVVGAVRRVVALQGQDVRANRLAVRVRTEGLTAGDVDRAEVVRTWAMRGTLHMVAAEDLAWVIRAVGAQFVARQAPRRRQLGLDDATCELGAAALATVLAGGPLTRREIVGRLADHGVSLAAGQAAPYLLAYAALNGLICRGPEKDEPTYVLVRDRVGERAAPDDVDALLARRYLAGYGPAAAEDLAAWSGLPLKRCRAAFAEIGDLLTPVDAGGYPAFVLRDQPLDPESGASVRLLGHFDAYLLGYRGRDLAVSPEFGKSIQTGGGFVMPAVAVDGKVVGTWRQRSTKDGSSIEVAPFTTISARLRSELDREAADLGRFLGQRTVLAPQAPASTV